MDVAVQGVVSIFTTLLRKGSCMNLAQGHSPVTKWPGDQYQHLHSFPKLPAAAPVIALQFSGKISSGGRWPGLCICTYWGAIPLLPHHLCDDSALQARGRALPRLKVVYVHRQTFLSEMAERRAPRPTRKDSSRG